VRHNFREDFRGFRQSPRAFCTDEDRGLLVCTWPKGGRPKVPTQYCDEVWTGLEYEVAALLLFEGLAEPALRILEAVRTRYDGRKQNPWNDVECGDHYARAMASWALLEAASGFTYEAAEAALGFAPVVGPRDYRAPFVARDGWGTFAQRATARRQTAELAVAWGTLEVRSLRLRALVRGRAVKVALDGRPVRAKAAREGDRLTLTFPRRVVLRAGGRLTVVVG